MSLRLRVIQNIERRNLKRRRILGSIEKKELVPPGSGSKVPGGGHQVVEAFFSDCDPS